MVYIPTRERGNDTFSGFHDFFFYSIEIIVFPAFASA